MTMLVAVPQPAALADGHVNPVHTSIARPEKDLANGHSKSSISTTTQPKVLTNGHSNHKKYQRVVPTAIDEIARRSPNAVFASIPKTSNPVDGYRDVTYRVYADTIDRAALLLEESIRGKDHGETIGYIGPSDLRYVILAIAAVKINMKMLYLSPRNSLEGQLHILEHAKCSVFASPLVQLAGVSAILSSRSMHQLIIPELEELLNGPLVPARPFTKTFEEIRHQPIVILHSSGSTSLPKPVGYTHGALAIQCSQLAYESQGRGRTIMQSTASAPRLLTGFPMFHAGGLFYPLGLAVFGEVQMVMPPAGQPLSADMTDKIIQFGDVQAACLPPVIIEELASKPAYLESIRHLEYFITGGAPLPQTVGDTIQRTGPRIYNLLASTETGVIPALEPDRDDWQYVRLRTDLGIELRPHSDDLYELVVVRLENCDEVQPVFENYPHLQEYATHDLFRRHPDPEKLDHWLSGGRFDDVIVLVNGEKFNPIAMEKEIQLHPDILSALVVGRDKAQAALLIEPCERLQRASSRTRDAFLHDIWPAVEQANSQGPAHGRIYQGLVMLTDPEKPMKRTPKGNVMRHATYQQYAEEIDTLYKAQAEPSCDINMAITSKDPLETTSIRHYFELAAFSKSSTLKDDDDLFEAGMDSLHVLNIVHQINTVMGKHFVEPATIYMNPSIFKLTKVLKREASPDLKAPQDRKSKIQEMLDNLSIDLPLAPQVPKVAILTGSSGSLGSHLLKALVKSGDFTHIYCLVRTLPPSLPYPPSTASFLLCDFSNPLLGLAYDTYTHLLISTTHILHNAWHVDFNLSLDTFTPHLRGVRHLVDFSARAINAPRIFFVSSVGTVLNAASPVKEQIYHEPDVAQEMGYAESKHIAERLLSTAGLKSNIKSTICRVGQIAGPVDDDGIWNKREWLPSIIATSKNMGCIPESLGPMGTIEWIPVDLLAQIILELFNSPAPLDPETPTQVFHIVNASPTDWTALLPTIISHLGDTIETVPLPTWMSRLRARADETKDLEKYPAVKLLGFLEGMAAGEKAGRVFPIMETERARKGSETLRGLGAVSGEWMGLWMGQWGFGGKG
ncbi:hypothetical protein MMC30_009171 [Trapelia coarctata]|nr:hypothetical protein [Trapelia coarctata]